MLDDAAAEDDHTGPLGADGHCVDSSNVLDDVDLELKRRGLESVEVEHVAQTAVRDGWTEDGNVVLVGPVIYRSLVVDLFAQSVNDLGGRPVDLLFSALARLLLLEHLVQNGNYPVLKGTVVGVGNDEVSYSVETLLSKIGTRGAEGAHVCVAQTLDEVLLDPTGSRDNG